MVTINADGLILGRFAAFAAKQALLGNEVTILNAEKAVISGAPRKTIVEAKYKKFVRGVPRKGPYYSRLPDRYVRRVIRGMIPYKTPRGREAFKRVLCYVGAPEGVGGEPVTVPGAAASKLPNLKRLTVGELCKEFGGKHDE